MMRSEAAMLSAQAESIAALAQQIQTRVEGIEFEGPAATRFQGAMADQSRQAAQLAGDLQELSNYILNAAARVEAQLAELQRAQLQAENQS